MGYEIKTIATGMTYTECPRWRDNRWWFSDFYTNGIYSMAEDGSDLRTELTVPEQPSGLGWLPDGRLIFVSMKDRSIMRREADGSVVVHADLSKHATGHVNDMVVDAKGRAYVGNFGFDLMGGGKVATADVHRVDPDGSVHVAATGLSFPNGSAITADGRTLLVDESFANRISAFEINPADGSLSNRRDWAAFAPPPSDPDAALAHHGPGGEIAYVPDGCGLDAEGCLWVADARNARVCRVREGGEILETINPGDGVFACMLGGADGRTLLMSCAPDFFEHKRRVVKEATLRTARVAVGHAGLP
jgi:sugar lactone lactonase YvrE